MNLNFHIVDVKATYCFEQDIETAAFAALMHDDSSEDSLMALAELVDWELATLGALTGQGKRCERALKQRVLACPFDTLVSMSGRSGVINELFWQLQAEAEKLDAFQQRLAA